MYQFYHCIIVINIFIYSTILYVLYICYLDIYVIAVICNHCNDCNIIKHIFIISPSSASSPLSVRSSLLLESHQFKEGLHFC
jgi:hypothetical protein